MNNLVVLLFVLCTLIPKSFSFVQRTSQAFGSLQQQQDTRKVQAQNNEVTVQGVSTQGDVEDPLGLTPELRKITDAFANIGDDKLRYKQLLYMATNSLKPMSDELKVDENKVPGCLSTVHVYATSKYDETQDKHLITYQGDSDGLLTKGLVALLVRGLSGYTAEEIQKVDPSFIKEAQISQSLTPGRNNGFLNMLSVMKQQALKTTEEVTTTADATPSTTEENDASNNDSRPIYAAISNTLQILKPTVFELEDVSYQHAGHAGNDGKGEESHFNLFVVSEAFEGLSLVQRHRLIYTLLGDVMPEIHALQIKSLTIQENENN